MPRLKEIYNQLNNIDPNEQSLDPYRQRVRFVAVYSNPSDDVFGMAMHAQDCDYPFIAVLDVDGIFADLLEIERTPEIVVMDKELAVRYHGAIDDQYFKGGAKPSARHHYLADALQSILNGRPVARQETVAPGCHLERRGRNRQLPTTTFYEDVLPILRNHCQICHRPDEVGPFLLISYQDAVDHAEMIQEVVEDRRMPPWPGESKHPFHNDRRLSSKQIATIVSWVNGGLQEGDSANAPEASSLMSAREWKNGQPDIVFEMEQPFRLPATGIIDYQYYRFKTNFNEDRWIRAVEMQPGNASVVHHMLAHQIRADTDDLGGLYMLNLYGGLTTSQSNSMIGDYNPGDENSTRQYGSKSGLRLKAGSDIVIELHYTPIGTEQTDRSRVGFLFSDTPPVHEIKSRLFLKPRGRFVIPKRHPHFRMQQTYWFEKDVRILGIRPHMHQRGKSYRLEMVHPDEEDRTATVLQVPVWDYNWHKTYMFKEPFVLPAGKELLATVNYDNSEFNQNNPDPNQEVRWGQGTKYEMFNTFFLYKEINESSSHDLVE